MLLFDFFFFFLDESSGFGCDEETQAESGAVNGCRSGDIWPSDLWSVSVRDQETDPIRSQVCQVLHV